jgi:uncharacterized protein DUF1259
LIRSIPPSLLLTSAESNSAHSVAFATIGAKETQRLDSDSTPVKLHMRRAPGCDPRMSASGTKQMLVNERRQPERVDEQPRLFFVHFWANDDAVKLAKGLQAALAKFAVVRS